MSVLKIPFNEKYHKGIEGTFGTKDVSYGILRAGYILWELKNSRRFKDFDLMEIKSFAPEGENQDKICVFWRDSNKITSIEKKFTVTLKEADKFQDFIRSKCDEFGIKIVLLNETLERTVIPKPRDYHDKPTPYYKKQNIKKNAGNSESIEKIDPEVLKKYSGEKKQKAKEEKIEVVTGLSVKTLLAVKPATTNNLSQTKITDIADIYKKIADFCEDLGKKKKDDKKVIFKKLSIIENAVNNYSIQLFSQVSGAPNNSEVYQFHGVLNKEELKRHTKRQLISFDISADERAFLTNNDKTTGTAERK